MGCCFVNQEVEENQDQVKKDNSKQQIYSQPSYKENGKKCFNEKKYQLAIQNFINAIVKHQKQPQFLPNFTNLALSYRAQKQFEKSIQIINKMMSLPQIISLKSQNLQFIIKGYILKSRSQTYLVKQYCFKGNFQSKGDDLIKNKERIQEAQKNLLMILTVQQMKPMAKKLNAQTYLETTKKVHRYFKKCYISQDNEDELNKYFKKRLKSEKAHQQIIKLQGLYGNPNQILQKIAQIMDQKNKQQLDQEDDDFIVDPIIYQVFNQPIIVPSGHTYQSSIIKEHFAKNGTFDPITHQEFKKELGVHNRTLSKYINETRQIVSKDHLNYIDY